MRILFVLRRFHTYQYFSVKALLDHGHDVAVFVQTISQHEDHSLVAPRCIPQSALSKGLQMCIRDKRKRRRARMHYGWASPTAMHRAMREFSPDVVVLGKLRGFNAVASVIAGLQGRRRILFDYSPATEAKTRLRDVAARVVGISPKVRFTLVSGAPGKDKPFCTNGVYHLPLAVEPPAAPAPERPLSAGRIRAISVGKFGMERKRQELLLEAFAPLCRRYDLELTLVGSGSENHPRVERLRQLAAQLGIADRVAFRFNLPYAQMLEAYLEHDVFVLPARDEPFGMVVLEAMAYGMPVICSDTCGSRDNLEVGINGEVFVTDSAADLQAKLESVVSEPERISRMGRESSRIVAERHLPRVYHDRLMRIIGDAGRE